MTPRRAPGEGSLYRHKGSGLWCWEITLGRLPDGRRHRIALYGRTRSEVLRKRDEVLRALRADGGLSASVSLARFLSAWLQAVSPSLAPSTAALYDRTLRRHVLPHLGQLRLNQLTTVHLQAWVSDLAATVSPRTACAAFTVLKIALRRARDWRLLATDPTQGVVLPRARPTPPRLWTIAEAQDALQRLSDHPLWPLVVLAITTGLRRGELLGLTWADVDAERGLLRVRQAVRREPGRVTLALPKGGRARLLTLPPLALQALERQRARVAALRQAAGPLWQEHDLVFPGPTGGPLHPDRLGDQWRKTLRTLGLPPCRLHDLRHLSATLLLEAGIPLRRVQARLGHSLPHTTLATYAHLLEASDHAAAQVLQAALDRTQTVDGGREPQEGA